MPKDDLGPGVWRTVGGRRIFIKDGQDLESAMYESGKFDSIIRKNKQKTIKMSKQEYAVFMHEVNTYYDMKNENRKILYKCIGDHMYMFDNFGFNNYNVFKKCKIVGNEDNNRVTMEVLDERKK
jgi:hypothetical protein